MPDCWITATENLVETKESFKPRPSSVEPPKTETTLLDDSEHKPEFKAYWHKAHRILRAFPQAKAKADGKIPNNHYSRPLTKKLHWSISNRKNILSNV